MKKFPATLFLTVLIMFSTMSVFAQVTTRRNNGAQKEPFLTRVSDWFATTGKTQKEKYIIQKNRRAARKIKKAKENIARKKKQRAK